MRIQHNISAMNANRNLTANNTALSKNLEKLSSGYKINRAGDDAAGLAISEKMRADIAIYDQSINNANDGISLIQTAEGALTEVHDMLNRLETLATQAATDTYDETARANIQLEVDQLLAEIDRINSDTKFNDVELFGGGGGSSSATKATNVFDLTGKSWGANDEVTVGSKTYQFDANAQSSDATKFKDTADLVAKVNANKDDEGWELSADGDKLTFTSTTEGSISGGASKVTVKVDSGATTLQGTYTDGKAAAAASAASAQAANGSRAAATAATHTFDLTSGGATTMTAGDTITIGTETYTFDSTASADNQFNDLNSLISQINNDQTTTGWKASDDGSGNLVLTKTTTGALSGAEAAAITATLGGVSNTSTFNNGTDATNGNGNGNGNGSSSSSSGGGGGFTFQISETSTLTANISATDTTTIGVNGLKLTTRDSAKTAIKTIKTAVTTVSQNRANLGAWQNRLEHTVNNLGVTKENLQSAESQIRDTNVADEMMEYTKNNILIQSAQAMLAQANQIPQGVLQLMQ